ncbi:MAG: family 16 glycosylhydrolase [Paludibacteraceae bacterium]|nr:family 16 glycosylhydrolase [Paludibacteraceae bacterium]
MRNLCNLILLAAVVALAACKGPDTPEQKDGTIIVSPVTLTLKVGDMSTIDQQGTATNIEWTSSNEEVATVYYGVVTAKAIGKAEVTARSGNTSATCIVYVTGTDGATLRISPPIVSLKKGDTYKFSYGNTYDLDMRWSSSDPSVATVDNTGQVTALASGNTTITFATDLESVTALVAVEHEWGEYRMVWSDEFNGSELDESVWGYNTGGGGWGNNEKQYYTNRPENIRVQNGCLEIEARKEEYNNSQYTSARILSKNKKTFTYGKIESRIKFPGGKGTWPAFWMMGNSGGWPNCGEIDIQEHVGSADARASFALHTVLKNGTKGNNWSKTQWFDYPLSADFHVYGIEWSQEEKDGKDVIRFYVDDVQYAEVWETQIDDNDSWPFNKPFFFIYNLAIGGNMGGQVDDTIFDQPRIMYVDWLRVWQRQESN